MTDPRDNAAFKRAIHSRNRELRMRPDQLRKLRDLCQQTDSVDLYRDDFTEAEAATLIDRLKEKKNAG